jgi:hypothetical protein
MKQFYDKHRLKLGWAIVAVSILGLAYLLSPEIDTDAPPIELNTVYFSKRTDNRAQELFDKFNKSFVTLKTLSELLEPGLNQLQESYKHCEEANNIACDSFLIKQSKVETLANALIAEHHRLENLMAEIRLLSAVKESSLPAYVSEDEVIE